MDDVELYIALKRMKTWPKEWRDMVLALPSDEARVICELAGLLDARPTNEEGKASE